MIVFQFSQNSCRNALLFNFDKNKKGEKRVSASKIWRFWLNRKTYMGVWGQWLRGSAVRAVGGIMLCSIILQKQYIVENNNKNEILKIQFWFSNYSAGTSFPALWLSFWHSLSLSFSSCASTSHNPILNSLSHASLCLWTHVLVCLIEFSSRRIIAYFDTWW